MNVYTLQNTQISGNDVVDMLKFKHRDDVVFTYV